MSVSKLNRCQNCGSTRVVSSATNTIHYGCWRCGNCNSFRGWIPKFETLERQRLQRIAIDKLLSTSRLTAWEEGFLHSLSNQLREHDLSPKQCNLLNRISFKYGVGIAPQSAQQEPPRRDGLFSLLWNNGGDE